MFKPQFGFGAQAEVVRLRPKGKFIARRIRPGCPDLVVKGFNDITTEGKNHLLDVVFHGSSQSSTWYIGLIDNDNFSSLLDADTLANHTGWDELVPGTDYTGNRQAWVEGAASSGSMTSSSDSTFPMLTTSTAYGILVCDVASGTSGVLMATGAFSDTIDLVNGDSLKVSYTITY